MVIYMNSWYGVATISRLLEIIGFFCRISSLLQGSFAKETFDFKDPTNRSHPICNGYHADRYVYKIIVCLDYKADCWDFAFCPQIGGVRELVEIVKSQL